MCRNHRPRASLRGIVVLALALPFAGPAATAVLTVGNISGSPGSHVSVPVTLEGSEAIVRVQFTLALGLSRPDAPPLIADPVPAPGTTPIVDLNTYSTAFATGMAESTGRTTLTGDLMKIDLTIPFKASEGTVYTLALSDVIATPLQIGRLEMTAVNGSVTVKGRPVAMPVLGRLEIVPNPASLTVGETEEFGVIGYDGANRVVPVDSVKWSVEPESHAVIDPDGILVALRGGDVKLFATSGNVSGAGLIRIGIPEGQAPGGALGIGSVRGAPGEVVKVPFLLESRVSLASLEFTVPLANPSPPALRLVEATAAGDAGVLTGGLGTDAAIAMKGGEFPIAPGTIGTLLFEIPKEAAKSYTLSPVVTQAIDTAGNRFVLPTKPGLIEVISATPPGMRGDGTGDGKVNIADAGLALRIAVQLVKPTAMQVEVLDVNGDGRIDVRDVTRILSFIVGLIKDL